VKEKIEYALVKMFLWLAKVAPRTFIYAFFRALAHLFYKIDKKRRAITLTNLSYAFPQKSEDEIAVLAQKVYEELSKTVAEILLLFVDRFDVDSHIVNKDEAVEKLQKLVSHSPKGIIVVTAHFSNWELAAHFLAKHGLPMLAVGREGNNKLIDKYITVPFREKYGNRATTKKKAMLSMAKALKSGEAVGLLIDQKSGEINSAKVDFFGSPAETTLSVAMLKQKFNPLVVPIFIAREADGRYRMIVQDPIEYTADEIEDKEEKLVAMTQKYSDAIESVIREYPQQWFWMHNRWRR